MYLCIAGGYECVFVNMSFTYGHGISGYSRMHVGKYQFVFSSSKQHTFIWILLYLDTFSLSVIYKCTFISHTSIAMQFIFVFENLRTPIRKYHMGLLFSVTGNPIIQTRLHIYLLIISLVDERSFVYMSIRFGHPLHFNGREFTNMRS